MGASPWGLNYARGSVITTKILNGKKAIIVANVIVKPAIFILKHQISCVIVVKTG